MYLIAKLSTRDGERRPVLRPVPGLPSYETRALPEKLVSINRKRRGWAFHSTPWFVCNAGDFK